MRGALGQLLEYSFWPRAQEAARLIVVGEARLDADARGYLDVLNRMSSFNLDYQEV